MQNRSHAVMAQRTEASDSRDDFPTPPWATRAFLAHVINDQGPLEKQTCLEPACGAGHMAKVLKEQFGEVRASDAFAYGYGEVRDFLSVPYEANAVDWVITNPPFRLAQDFVERALIVARKGVAVLVRTVFIESVGRYRALFEVNPPTIFAQYCERVPMVKGRLDQKASTATGYAWLVWEKERTGSSPLLTWIPPSRKSFERATDYPA
ncbi:MAG: SAM-dependent methyltransferase [Xanthobacteraceae bacterium]|nr:SAM-dependent methyltransferase [Xanthobacteraceae bacterium]